MTLRSNGTYQDAVTPFYSGKLKKTIFDFNSIGRNIPQSSRTNAPDGPFFRIKLIAIKLIFSKEFMLEDIGSVIAGIFFVPYYFLAFTGASKEVLVWAAFITYFVYCANSVQYLVRISLEKRGERHSMQGHA